VPEGCSCNIGWVSERMPHGPAMCVVWRRIPRLEFGAVMGGSPADRNALMKAIKRELKQTLWDEPDSRPPSDRYRSLFNQNPEPMWIYNQPDVESARRKRGGDSGML
jgi:hypothetical protein